MNQIEWPFVHNAMSTYWHELPYEQRMIVIQKMTIKMYTALN